MNLIEALKTRRPHHQPGYFHYNVFEVSDILADDWEAEPEPQTYEFDCFFQASLSCFSPLIVSGDGFDLSTLVGKRWRVHLEEVRR